MKMIIDLMLKQKQLTYATVLEILDRYIKFCKEQEKKASEIGDLTKEVIYATASEILQSVKRSVKNVSECECKALQELAKEYE